jgi:hypothetical protein
MVHPGAKAHATSNPAGTSDHAALFPTRVALIPTPTAAEMAPIQKNKEGGSESSRDLRFPDTVTHKRMLRTHDHRKPGMRLGRYQLLQRIGRGGMGEVWQARLMSFGVETQFAIKILHGEGDQRDRTLLLDEARMISRIRGAHVVSLVEIVEVDNMLALVMDWVDGIPLTVAQKAGQPLPLGIALRIVADACTGLHTAHELKDDDGRLLEVVHRDVSPQNLLIDRNGTTRVIDFGIARSRARLAQDTLEGVSGKVAYMSHEHAHGYPVDRRTDVFALGVVLYQSLTGHLPFGETSDMAILEALGQKKAFAPLSASIPLSVANVLKRALAHDKGKRFASALAMKTEIEATMVDCSAVTDAADVARFLQSLMPGAATEITWAETLSRPPPAGLAGDTSPVANPAQPAAAAVFPVGLPLQTQAYAPRVDAHNGATFSAGSKLLLLAALGFAIVLASGIAMLQTLRPTMQRTSFVRSIPTSHATSPALLEAATVSTSTSAVLAPASPVSIIRSAPPRGVGAGAPSAKLPACDPPYRLDAAGHRIYLRECLQ